jgi:hypothetical protein
LQKDRLLSIRFAILLTLLAYALFGTSEHLMGDTGGEASDPTALKLLSRETSSGSLVSIDELGLCLFLANDEFTSREYSLDEIVQWGRCTEPRQGPVIVCTNGDLIVADVRSIDGEGVRFVFSASPVIDDANATLETGGVIRSLQEHLLPLERVAGVVFLWPSVPVTADRLVDEIVRSQDRSDVCRLCNGDRLNGTIRGYNARSGLQIDTDLGSITLTPNRLDAIVMTSLLRERSNSATLHAVLGFTNGSRLTVDSVEYEVPLSDEEDSKTLVRLAGGGPTWTLPGAELSCVAVRAPQVEYLSDRTPVEFVHIPHFTMKWPYQNDRSVLGTRLRTGGVLHLKGVGVHSASRLTYQLGPQDARFAAEVALDDTASVLQDGVLQRGSVEFRVYVDGEERFNSGIVRGGDAPIPVEIEFDEASRLDLLVDYGERADVLDRADWLGARIIRREVLD